MCTKHPSHHWASIRLNILRNNNFGSWGFATKQQRIPLNNESASQRESSLHIKMTESNDDKRLKRATTNLKKVAVFLALIGFVTLYLGWIRYSLEGDSIIQEMVWTLRIVSILIVYASLKCFLIGRYLGPPENPDTR